MYVCMYVSAWTHRLFALITLLGCERKYDWQEGIYFSSTYFAKKKREKKTLPGPSKRSHRARTRTPVGADTSIRPAPSPENS